MAHRLEEKERTADVLLNDTNITFKSLLLPEAVFEGLTANGFHKPSPIQLKAVPLGRCGFDLIVKAKSGTGKTAVFGIIALETIDVTITSPQVLILAPTREIAIQIEHVLKAIGVNIKGLAIESFIGGLPVEQDIVKLRRCHIAIGSPGRVKSLIENKHLQTNSIRLFVLDEADKLLDQTFQADINQIYHHLPARKQVIAASATYPNELDSFLENYMHSPTHVTAYSDSAAATTMLLGLRQFVSVVQRHSNVMAQMKIKTAELERLLSGVSFTQCIVFFNYQVRAESISNNLNQKGWNTNFITAAQGQKQRIMVMEQLKELKCRVLLSSDLTARGIDAANVDLVINYEVPFDTSTYLHRIGRAGRYGSSGTCITIASTGEELQNFQNILGTIGGTELTIPKLPTGDLSAEIFASNLEVIHGLINENKNGLSDGLKESVMTLKPEKRKIRNDDGVSLQLEKLTVDEDKKDFVSHIDDVLGVSKKNVEEMFVDQSAELLLQSLAAGTAIEIVGDDKKDVCRDTKIDYASHFNNALKANDTSEESVLKNTQIPDARSEPRENRPIPDINRDLVVEKNVALFNLARLLTENPHFKNNRLSDELVVPIGNYLTLKKEADEALCAKIKERCSNSTNHEILENIPDFIAMWKSQEPHVKDENSGDEFERIFSHAYDYAIEKSSRHWSEVIAVDIDRELREAEQKAENALSENLMLVADRDEAVEEMAEGNAQASAANPLEWVPVVSSSAVQGYVNPECNYSDTYASYFNYYSDVLAKDALTFENVESFDRYFVQWQSQVASVGEYVQQNIYLQEMNNYHYYGS